MFCNSYLLYRSPHSALRPCFLARIGVDQEHLCAAAARSALQRESVWSADPA